MRPRTRIHQGEDVPTYFLKHEPHGEPDEQPDDEQVDGDDAEEPADDHTDEDGEDDGEANHNGVCVEEVPADKRARKHVTMLEHNIKKGGRCQFGGVLSGFEGDLRDVAP